MPWCRARAWVAAGQRLLGRAGISLLVMLESLGSSGRYPEAEQESKVAKVGRQDLKVRWGDGENQRRQERSEGFVLTVRAS